MAKRAEDMVAIPADPDDPEDFDVTEAALQRALIEREERLRRLRGPQRAPVKQQISLRLDPDVIAKFRATGRGWQARMNAVLKAASV